MGIDFTGVTLPFEVADLLTSAMGLLKILGPFVLLGLAIMFVPKLISVIRTSAATKGGK
ncbi:hypothetical protein LIS82_07845 [Cytobacillus solani]|uniref:hypothetical protein n=1 Tax=Cytobacillus solani TaxID=1637975 RepID=UPI00207AE990|nr:hypothetical protein [Cytobacillus solani]USK56373.1 hypothetical protein LIS82_07845 [Cytobacillus solani]